LKKKKASVPTRGAFRRARGGNGRLLGVILGGKGGNEFTSHGGNNYRKKKCARPREGSILPGSNVSQNTLGEGC